MSRAESAVRAASAGPRMAYVALDPRAPLPSQALLAVGFGPRSAVADPRHVHVGLRALRGGGWSELWCGCGPIVCGREGALRYAADDEHLAGAIEVDERAYAGLAAATEAAYAHISRFQRQSGYRHLLRIWNYFDAINRGAGDEERYRQFCLGRAAGLAPGDAEQLPAATAIGRRDGSALLTIYWLAGRRAGLALENPRQFSAYHYPRRYGPAAPRFSRAMLIAGPKLMISGTASIVGHASRHNGDLRAQLTETVENLRSLQQRALVAAPALAAQLGAASLVKIYLRDAAALEELTALCTALLPEAPTIVLEADICRSELLLEIDCVHSAAQS
jgi:chorismate lyase / 3-hydroxybenzoate synthase